MNSKPRASRRRVRLSSLEVLEARIAPASFQLPAAGGPFTLSVNSGTSHLQIRDGGNNLAFDAGVAPGDLTITDAGTNSLTIQNSAGVGVSLTGMLNVHIGGSITVSGDISADTSLVLVSNASITTMGALFTGQAQFSAANGISINGSLSSSLGAVTLNADSDNNGTGVFTLPGGAEPGLVVSGALASATISITAADMSIGAAIDAGSDGHVALLPTNLRDIDLGTNTAGKLGLTDSELDFITADTLQVGSNSTTQAMFTNIISPANYLTLQVPLGNITATGGFLAQLYSGDVYQKISVSNAFSINSSASLAVSIAAGYTPQFGDSYTIIDVTSNNGVTGAFAGKPEGSLVPVNGVNKTITYHGNGNDVILQSMPTLTATKTGGMFHITDTGGGDNQISVAVVGGIYQIYSFNDTFSYDLSLGGNVGDGGHSINLPLTSAFAQGLDFNLGGGNDSLILDFSHGNIIPPAHLTYEGGGDMGDALDLGGGNQGTVTDSFTSHTDGQVNFSNYGVVNYTGIAVLQQSDGFTNLAINLPAALNEVLLGTGGPGFSNLISSPGTFPKIVFGNPTDTLSLTPGSFNDVLTVDGLASFGANVTLGDPVNTFFQITYSFTVSLVGGHTLKSNSYSTTTFDATAQISLLDTSVLQVHAVRNILVLSGASITGEDGLLSLVADGTDNSNYTGLSVGGSIVTTGSGSIDLHGKGGFMGTSNVGIDLHGTVKTMGSGSILLFGQGGSAGDANSGIVAIGTISGGGGVFFHGTAGLSMGESLGIDLGTTVTSGGMVLLETDTGIIFEPSAAINAGTHLVALQPKTGTPTVKLGSTDFTGFGVDDAMLDAITAGTVQIGAATSGNVVVTGTVSSTNNLSVVTGGGVTGSFPVSVAAGETLSIVAGADVNLSGAITAPTVSVQAGTHDLTFSNASNDFGTISVPSGGVVTLRDETGFDVGSAAFTALSLQSNGPITQSGSFSGGTLLKLGGGTLTLSNANTLSGTTISNGAIMFSDAGAFGAGQITLGDANTGNNPVSLLATVDLAQHVPNAIVVPSLPGTSVATIGHTPFSSFENVSFNGAVTLSRATTFSSPTSAPGGLGSTSFFGGVGGSVGQLTLTGGGVVALTGPNTFVGALQVTGTGTALVVFQGPDVLPDATDVSLAAGTNMFLEKNPGESEAINKLTGLGTVGTSPSFPGVAQSLTVGANGGTFTFDGLIAENGSKFSLVKAGAGIFTLTNDNTYTGSTKVTGGTLALVNSTTNNNIALSTPLVLSPGTTLDATGLNTGEESSTFALDSGQVLVGSNAAIVGNLSGAGSIRPGGDSSAGKLTVNGDFIYQGTIIFDLQAPFATGGVDFDQIVVTGNLNLDQSTLLFSGATSSPAVGTMIKLIDHTGANSTTSGSNPPEGATVHVGAANFSLSYDGGDDNDVVLTTLIPPGTLGASLASGTLSIVDTDANGKSNNLTVTRSGANLVITDAFEQFASTPAGGVLSNNNQTLTIPFSAVTAGLKFFTGGGDDKLTLDFSGGNVIAAGGLVYSGGSQATATGDQLVIVGGNQGTVTYDYSGPDDGSITMSNFGGIIYGAVESTSNAGTITNLVVNLPVGGAPSTAIFGDDGGAGNGLSRLGGSTFEQTDFANPTGTLTIHQGTANDSLLVQTVPDFHAGLTLGLPLSPFATLNFAGALTLSAGMNLSAFATNLTVASNLSTSGAGTISLAAAALTVANGASLLSAAGEIDLTADKIDLSGTVSSAGTVQVLPRTAGTTIDLGGADVAGTLGLTATELSHVTAGLLKIGNGSTGGIVFSSTVNYASDLSLTTGAGISGAGGLALPAGKNFSLAAVGTIGLSAPFLIPGTTTLTSGADISLNNAGNDFGTVLIMNGQSVTLRDDGGFNLGGSTVSTILSLESAGAITQTGQIGGPGALVKLGPGQLTLSMANPYGGTTSVQGGTLALVNASGNNDFAASPLIDLHAGTTLDVTGLAAQTLSLATTQTLQGAGATITGNLAGSGTLLPGGAAMVGRLTITGDLKFAGTITFDVNSPYAAAATDYDQLVVGGNLDLNAATLQFLGGATAPTAALALKLIDHTGGSATIAGHSPAEGASAAFGNASFGLSYAGGDGNDVTLAFAGNGSAAGTLVANLAGGALSFSDTDAAGKNNALTVSIVGTNLVITDAAEKFNSAPLGGVFSNNFQTLTFPLASILSGVTFNTGGGDDTLTLDFTAGNVIPAGGLVFNGGGQATPAGDKLVIAGGSQGTVTYDFTNAHDGSITMSAYGSVTYTGLEPITNSGTATDLVFNLPATANSVTLGDDGTAGNGISRLSGATFELTDFTAPSGSVTIHRGTAGDSITLQSLPDFHAGLTLGSAANPFGAITFAGTIVLDVGQALAALAGDLTVSTGATLTTPNALLLSASQALSLAAGTTVTFGAATFSAASGSLAGALQGASLDLETTSISLSGAAKVGSLQVGSGVLLLTDANALRNGTFTAVANDSLHFAGGIGSFLLGGLAGTATVILTDTAAKPVTLHVGGANADSSFSGSLDGAGALVKEGTGQFSLLGATSFSGPTTIAAGVLQLGNENALQNSTVTIPQPGGLVFAGSSQDYILGGLAGADDLVLETAGGLPINFAVGHNNADTAYAGNLSGAGRLVKVGTGTLVLTGKNTQAGGTLVVNGSLVAGTDAALGQKDVPLTFDGGTFHASSTLALSRPIFLESGTATFEASPTKTLTLSGVITGPGDLFFGSTGVVRVTNSHNSNSGSVELPNGQPMTVNGVSVAAPGAHGDIIVTPGPTPGTITSIDITGANVPISLVVNAPKTGAVTIAKIISDDTTTIKKIVLGQGVTLGNGTDDAIPDLLIGGKLGKLVVRNVLANTIIALGKDLPYLSTYANRPNITLNGTLGANVTIDVTADSGLPGGVGGGGLGKVVVNSWSAPSVIKTSQSIKSIKIKHGDFGGNVIVDPNHLGAATVANVGRIAIPNGQWVGTGMQVEGIVAKFLTAGVSEGTKISAGAFGPVAVKGDYLGSLVATADPSVADSTGKKIATGGIASVAITGDFTGLINGDGKVGDITLGGTGRFMGTLRGGSLGDIMANSFTGSEDVGRHSITAIGSIGAITARSGGLTDYLIAAGTDLGSDAVFGGVADHFASYTTSASGVKTAVQVGAVTVKSGVTRTTIAAGIDPGRLGIYGDLDDAIALPAAGVKPKIGAIKVGLASLSLGTATTLDVTDAFEAATVASVQLGKGKPTPIAGNHYVDSGGTSIIVRTFP